MSEDGGQRTFGGKKRKVGKIRDQREEETRGGGEGRGESRSDPGGEDERRDMKTRR